VQYFLFIDSGLAYGSWISIEALLTPIVGGVGTVFGPLLGALVVRGLGEGAQMMAGGEAPGLDLVVYGCLLVLIIWFAPRGLMGGLGQLRSRLMRTVSTAKAGHG
jgi:branched-chain amino acid transport system permease protein